MVSNGYVCVGCVSGDGTNSRDVEAASVWGTIKVPGMVGGMAVASNGADSLSWGGESAVAIGELGSGKSMSSYSTGGSDALDVGVSMASGIDSCMVVDCVCVVSWCDCTGTAP